MWAIQDSNLWPTPRQGVALPTELTAQCLPSSTTIQKFFNKNKPPWYNFAMFDTRDLFEDSDLLKAETFKPAKNPKSQVTYYPKRGGLISSIKLNGKEILYLDEKTFIDSDAPIRGGIPVLFPNAGELDSPKFTKLKRHGFARDMKWESVQGKNGFSENLSSDADTKKMFPYDFRSTLSGEFDQNGSFIITQSVHNNGLKKDMPVAMGLHPYFLVASKHKKDIKFNFKGGEIIQAGFKEWSTGGTVYIPNPGTPMEVVIPGVGTLVLEASPAYERIWVWSQKDKDFICIEPVMRDPGGLADDPAMVAPGSTLIAEFKITLK